MSRRAAPSRGRAGEARAPNACAPIAVTGASLVDAPELEEHAGQTALALLSSVLVPIVRAAVRAELDMRLPDIEPRAAAQERLRLRAAADALGRSERAVRRLIAAGRLRAVRVSSTGSSPVLIARAEIDRFLRELEGP